VHGQLAFRSALERHEYLSAHDPDYASAHSWRRGGTAVAIAGGGAGMVLTMVGYMMGMVAGLDNGWDGDPDDDDERQARTLLVGGLVTTAVSLSVGLSMALSAHSTMKSIRERYPIVGLGASDRGGSVQVGWRF
jgi:hypothetical protein